MMQDNRLDTAALITHRFPLASYDAAYSALQNERPLGIVIDYPGGDPVSAPAMYRRSITVAQGEPRPGPRVAFVGAGNHASRSLMPAFARTSASIATVVANSGVNAVQAGRKFHIREVSTDLDSALGRADIDAVVIATRHDSHASLVQQALSQRKHVFVEKPLCTTFDQLSELESRYNSLAKSGVAPKLMVGFNRRFAPHVVRMKSLLAKAAEPKAILITVNAGAIPGDHWTQDPVDGWRPHYWRGLPFHRPGPLPGRGQRSYPCTPARWRAPDRRREDQATISLRFADGSMAVVAYLANGHRGFPKERVEVFSGGRVLQLDNFRVLRGFGWKELPHDAIVAPGQGHCGLRRGVRRCDRQRPAKPHSRRRVVRGRSGHVGGRRPTPSGRGEGELIRGPGLDDVGDLIAGVAMTVGIGD